MSRSNRNLIPSISRAARAERQSVLATPAARILLAASVVMATGSCVASLSTAGGTLDDDTVQLAMHSSTVATIVFALLAGLYSASTDRRFGFIDERLLSEPRRPVVLAAKALAVAAVGWLYGFLGALTAAVTAWSYFASQGESLDLLSPLVTRALVGVIIAGPFYAAFGAALGMIMPSQPMAIGGTLSWLLIIEPTLIVGLPDIGGWMPGAAGLALTNSPDPALVAQGAGGVLLAAYTVAGLGLAVFSFGRADI
ncbi:MAG: hypothetical protein GY929_00060 [Actinomycetia bacterium]|nr:hypothetical protein [Actinomycetes bacterium]